MTIDVFRCYYEAECVFAGVLRKAALVTLTSDSEAGQIRYTAAAGEDLLGQAPARGSIRIKKWRGSYPLRALSNRLAGQQLPKANITLLL
ncbi:MAG: hypothetical protein IKR10_09800 [Firmicutes bacterium]|nr:hypothetical protein [Bacillota bacterium]